MTKTGLLIAAVTAVTVSFPHANAQIDVAGTDVRDTIVVTGSKIERSGFDTPTPTTVIDQEAIALTGLNTVADFVAQLPAFFVGVAPANSTDGNDGGAQLVNLRGLGTNRTLVVVNGRRRVSGSASIAGVDLATIPSAMVDRVEIVTGGASAVYGADAVSGVVNIVLRDDFEGLELEARGGVSEEGGGDNYAFNAFAGTKFHDGRGSVTLAASYNNQNSLNFSQREISQTNSFSIPNPANTGPNDGIFDNILFPDIRFFQFSYGGLFNIADVNYTIDPDLRPIMNEGLTGTFFDSFSHIGGDGWNPADWFQHFGDQETISGYGTLSYDLDDNVRFFSELDYTRSTTDVVQTVTLLFGGHTPTIRRENPFISDELGDLLDANGVTSFPLTKALFDAGPAVARHERDTINITAGLDGDFRNDWTWSVFGQYGSYDNDISTVNTYAITRLLQASDVISDPVTGQPVCRDPSGGCVPVNFLGRNSESPEALEFINHTRLQSITNRLNVIGATLNGDLISLPAGPIRFATGFEYREERLVTVDDELALAGDIAQFGIGTPNRDVGFDVTEGYVEVLVPILADLLVAQKFDFEGAVRFSDYSTIGSTTAWRLGANWTLNDEIRLRATRSSNVRAPNLIELFAPQSTDFIPILDPCDAMEINNGSANRAANCAALGIPDGFMDPNAGFSKVSVSGGNPNLDEESSDSLTIGAVITPGLVEGLRISIDYWDIEIKDAVSSIAGQRIVDQCVDVATIDNPFCAQLDRGAELGIETVRLQEINIGKLSADGLDVEIGYGFDIGRNRIDLSYLGSFLFNQDELVDVNDPTTLIERAGEADRPQERMYFTANFGRGPFSANFRTRYIGPSKIDNLASDEGRDDNNIDRVFYQDVTLGYAFSDKTSGFIGVNNVFDKQPQFTESTTIPQNNVGPLYDYIGRFFHFRVQHRF
jgi:outer membrane receptor protein involved in Fe transport